MAAFTARAVKLVALGGVAIPVIGLNGRISALTPDGDEDPKYVRACDIPMYPVSKQIHPDEIKQQEEVNVVKEYISTFRKAATLVFNQIVDTTDNVKTKFDIGVEHSKATLDYVQTNPGELPRVVFISVATMGGVVAGYRGGILRKFAYASIAGLSSAALCYPHYTVDLSNALAEDAKSLWKENIGWPLKDTDDPDPVTKKTPMNASYDGKGDPGQSEEEDRDLYSRRSS